MSRNEPRTEAGVAFARRIAHFNILGDIGSIRAIEDEAAATERRLTVERVRAEVHEYMEHASLMAGELKIDRDDFDSILDDLATADVDEEVTRE